MKGQLDSEGRPVNLTYDDLWGFMNYIDNDRDKNVVLRDVAKTLYDLSLDGLDFQEQLERAVTDSWSAAGFNTFLNLFSAAGKGYILEKNGIFGATEYNTTYFNRYPEAQKELEDLKGNLVYRGVPNSDAPRDVLVIGCSTGKEPWTYAELFRRQSGKEISVLGIDGNTNNISDARSHRERMPNDAREHYTMKDGQVIDSISDEAESSVRFVPASLGDDKYMANLPSESFDFIAINNVLQYLFSGIKSKVYETVGRVLRPGGVFMATDGNKTYYDEMPESLGIKSIEGSKWLARKEAA